MSIETGQNGFDKPSEPALGQRAFGGAIWTFGQTAGGKLAGIAAQLILAAILTKGDFGQVAEVILIVTLASLGRKLGISEILIRRHRRFPSWAQVAFWISLCAGLLSAALVAAVSPFADLFFRHTHGLQSLLLVAAVGLPFDAVTLVPQAKLQVDLRFRALAVLGTLNVVVSAALSVGFAATSLVWPHSPLSGAMSIILPRPLMSAAIMIASFWLSGFRPKSRISPRRWWIILRDSRYFFVTGFFNTFLTQGDYLLASLFFSTDQLGVYYFAFNLSTQAVQVITANLASVLLPSFSKLDQEPGRQHAAYLKICSMLAMIGFWICMLQGILAGPFLHVVFGGKWDEAVPLFEFLTIGMAFVIPSGPAVSLMLAQGRYRKFMVWTILITLAFLSAVWLGALSGSTTGIAIADMAFYMIFGPLGVFIALPTGLRVLADIGRVYLGPVIGSILGTLGALCCLWLSRTMPHLPGALVAAIIGMFIYLGGAMVWNRADLLAIVARLKPLVRRSGRLTEGSHI